MNQPKIIAFVLSFVTGLVLWGVGMGLVQAQTMSPFPTNAADYNGVGASAGTSTMTPSSAPNTGLGGLVH